MLERIGKSLAALERRGRSRRLVTARGIDFTSNDYLALAAAPEMREAVIAALEDNVPIGAGGSRLLRGNHPAHEALETRAAEFFGAEAALFFGSGYLANLALWSALPGRDDLVVYDERSHASTLEGIRAGGVRAVAARHNDGAAVEEAIKAWRAGGGRGVAWVAVESLYSMDGDMAPLADMMAVVDRHDGVLVVDEAHATGVLGPGGRGLTAALEGRQNMVSIHTCGKALGAMGALVCGPRPAITFLVNRARAFIYATAPSPLMAVAVDCALTLVAEMPERRKRLSDRVAFANGKVRELCGRDGSGTQIIPIVLGQDRVATSTAATLQAAGYDVRAIRPPTVPEGTARLRIAITLNATNEDVDGLFGSLAAVLRNET